MRAPGGRLFWVGAVAAAAVVALWVALPSAPRTVEGLVQTRPGGPMRQAEVRVHRVPTNLPTVDAGQAPLDDGDLVLGVVVDGSPVAYPIRFLALYEILDTRVGGTPLAPSW